MEREEKITLLAAFYIVLISIAAIFLFFAEKKPSIGYTQLYLEEGAYSDALDRGAIVFAFTIANHEGKDMNYSITYLLGDARIESESIFVENSKKATISKTIKTRFAQPLLPIKFTINAFNNVGKQHSVWFWIKHIN